MGGSFEIELAFGEMPNPPKNDNLIYHYCSLGTLDAILRSKKIRLYDLHSMNDPSELFLRDIDWSEKILSVYKRNPFPFEYIWNGHKSNMSMYLNSAILQRDLLVGGRNTTVSLGLCMSKEENSLPQWRLYGDNGNGVCLGFDKKVIQTHITEEENFALQEIEYVDGFDELSVEISKGILRKIKELREKGVNETFMLYRDEMLKDIFKEAVKYKVKDYAVENEVRLVYQKSSTLILPNASPGSMKKFLDDDMELDVSRKNIRLYKMIDLEKMGLKAVILGPQNQSNKKMVNMLLAKRGFYEPVEIYKSTIPYRD